MTNTNAMDRKTNCVNRHRRLGCADSRRRFRIVVPKGASLAIMAVIDRLLDCRFLDQLSVITDRFQHLHEFVDRHVLTRFGADRCQLCFIIHFYSQHTRC